MLQVAKEAEFSSGTIIIREGTVGDDLHLVLEGQATVTVGDREVAKAKPGDTSARWRCSTGEFDRPR